MVIGVCYFPSPQSLIPITPYPQRGPRVPQSPIPKNPEPKILTPRYNSIW
ncbi:hypothetical protein FDUTEX481_03315 [Tolypothrix sp. PCC 7601]|nr:hypothetical protein FDUTEX481_03315 [Tolypothrix sp. PCC 7601]